VLLRHAAPELVAAAEAKLRGQPVDPAVFIRAAAGLTAQDRGKEIDTVVLACTHFPLVALELAEAFGGAVNFVHGGSGIARRVQVLVGRQSFVRVTEDLALFTGKDEAAARQLAPALAELGLHQIAML
jgi:glutamate racemase